MQIIAIKFQFIQKEVKKIHRKYNISNLIKLFNQKENIMMFIFDNFRNYFII